MILYLERISKFDILEISTSDLKFIKTSTDFMGDVFLSDSDQKYILKDAIKSKNFKKIDELFKIFSIEIFRDVDIKHELHELYLIKACEFLHFSCLISLEKVLYFRNVIVFMKYNNTYSCQYQEDVNEYICCFDVEHDLLHHPEFLRLKEKDNLIFIKTSQFGYLVKKEN